MAAVLGAGPHAVPTRSAGLGYEPRRPGLQSVRPLSQDTQALRSLCMPLCYPESERAGPV